MPRTRATFDFVYGLAGRQLHGDPAWFCLDYHAGAVLSHGTVLYRSIFLSWSMAVHLLLFSPRWLRHRGMACRPHRPCLPASPACLGPCPAAQ